MVKPVRISCVILMFVVCVFDKFYARFVDKEEYCGTLSHYYPVIKTRPLQLRFKPKNNETTNTFSWMALKDGERISLSNDTNPGIAIYDMDNVFYLNHDGWHHYGYSFYIFEQHSRSCEAILPIKESDIGECGYLERKTDDLIAGGEMKLSFVPTSSVWKNFNSSELSWLHTPSKCSTNCNPREISSSYDIDMDTELAEYVLRIPKTSHETSGVYVVECQGGRSNEINISIVVYEKPSTPVLLPLTEIDDGNFIVGREDKPLDISCNTTGGTNTAVEIFIGQGMRTTVLKNDLYTLWDNYYITPRSHLKEVTCKVYSSGLQEPFTVSSKIYVVKNPSKPLLTVDESIEFQHIGIKCNVNDGRPKPKIKYTIDGNDVDDNNLNQEDILDEYNLYRSEASIKSVDRSWNLKKIKCCALHELYSTNNICSIEKDHTYKYPTGNSTVLYLRISCTVENANPAYEIYWSGKGINRNLTEKSITKTEDGGFTTTQTVTLNVTALDNQANLTCYATSSHFQSEKITHQLKLPALPEVHINVTNGTLDVTNGESIVIECSASGQPRPQLSWNSTCDIESDCRESQCRLHSSCFSIGTIDKKHVGLYTCIAENKFGSTNKTVELNLTGAGVQLSLPPLHSVWMIIGLISLVIFILLVVGVSVFIVTRYKRRSRI